MKLYRFTAADSHRAMTRVHDLLGPEAMVYSTHKTSDGIEILAGISDNAHPHEVNSLKYQVPVQNAVADHQMIENLCNQVQLMHDSIQVLMNNVIEMQLFINQKFEKKRLINWNEVWRIMNIQIHLGVYFKRLYRLMFMIKKTIRPITIR